MNISADIVVPAGGFIEFSIPGVPCTVAIFPYSGDTIKVEQSLNGRTLNPNPVNSGVVAETSATVIMNAVKFVKVEPKT
jgi:hypothetical protein